MFSFEFQSCSQFWFSKPLASASEMVSAKLNFRHSQKIQKLNVILIRLGGSRECGTVTGYTREPRRIAKSAARLIELTCWHIYPEKIINFFKKTHKLSKNLNFRFNFNDLVRWLQFCCDIFFWWPNRRSIFYSVIQEFFELYNLSKSPLTSHCFLLTFQFADLAIVGRQQLRR